MAQTNRPIRIRTLPKSDEQPRKKALKTPKLDPNHVVIAVAVVLAWLVFNWDSSDPKLPRSSFDLPNDGSPEAKINKYLQDGQFKRQMEMRSREMENKVLAKPLGTDASIEPESDRTLGVSLEQENNAQKVYDDLYGDQAHVRPAPSPEDRINARLEQEQWLSQMEKQERRQYVQNFIDQAYEAGYAITLDENLIVVKVKKVQQKPKLSLDQVLENLARKGY